MEEKKITNIPGIIREFEKRANVKLKQEDWNVIYDMIEAIEEHAIEKTFSYLNPKAPWE